MNPDALDGRLAAAKGVADAVLYEGYVLYPYRASSRKNQLRWQFGVLAPRLYSGAEEAEPWSMRTQIVVEARSDADLSVRVRALQVQSRSVFAIDGDEPVAALDVDGELWTTFDEAVEHQVDVGGVTVGTERSIDFELPAARHEEPIVGIDGRTAGRVVRQRWPVSCRAVVGLEPHDGPYVLKRLTISVENTTAWNDTSAGRDEVVRHSMVAVHALAAIDGGRFVSMLDPPEFAREVVSACSSVGAFPVLISDDVVLSSPIILYDYPAVAPESAGDMFDATEIDEILALRVLTLTDEEKREARGTDPRAAAIVDRCDSMDPAAFEALHGAFRSIRSVGSIRRLGTEDTELPWWEPEVDASFDPWSDTVRIGPWLVGKGTKVRLRPSRRSDAQDLFVAGRTATVAGVFHDVDNEVYLAVVLDDDPAADLHQWHGRYLYFDPDEVEVEP